MSQNYMPQSSSGNRFGFLFLFTAGFVLGIIALYFFYSRFDVNMGGFGKRTVFGTMAGVEVTNLSDMQSQTFTMEDFSGEARTQVSDQIIVTEFDFSSENAVTVNLSYDSDKMELYGLRPITRNDSSTVMSGKDLIKINNTGAGKYLVLFKNPGDLPEQLTLEVVRDGRVVGTDYVTLPQP